MRFCCQTLLHMKFIFAAVSMTSFMSSIVYAGTDLETGACNSEGTSSQSAIDKLANQINLMTQGYGEDDRKQIECEKSLIEKTLSQSSISGLKVTNMSKRGEFLNKWNVYFDAIDDKGQIYSGRVALSNFEVPWIKKSRSASKPLNYQNLYCDFQTDLFFGSPALVVDDRSGRAVVKVYVHEEDYKGSDLMRDGVLHRYHARLKEKGQKDVSFPIGSKILMHMTNRVTYIP